jgi:hypothetical protein
MVLSVSRKGLRKLNLLGEDCRNNNRDQRYPTARSLCQLDSLISQEGGTKALQ